MQFLLAWEKNGRQINKSVWFQDITHAEEYVEWVNKFQKVYKVKLYEMPRLRY